MSHNIEYKEYTDFFRKNKFHKRLEMLSKKFKGKKVLLYGTGLYFSALVEGYDFRKYFDIAGVSDIKYLKENISEYMGFRVFNPRYLDESKAEVVICTTVNPNPVADFMFKYDMLPEGAEFITLNEKTPEEKREEFVKKIKMLLQYFCETINPFKTAKYALFLNSREIETKINHHKIIKKIRNRDTQKEPVRVLFMVDENSKWGYQSVYDELKKDKNFEVLPILCYPIITAKRVEYLQKENIDFFKKLGMEAIDAYDEKTGEVVDLKTLNPDIVFYQQPWYLYGFKRSCEVSKYALPCIVSYGYSSISVKAWGSAGVRKICANLWRMFCESPYHKKFYEQAACIAHKEVLLTTGYPKMDYYAQPTDPEFEALWKDPGHKRKRIIWAPHHTVDPGSHRMSNFVEHHKFFLEFAKNNKQYAFVFKPHPALRYKCEYEGIMTLDEFDKYTDEWRNLENGNVWDKGHYFDIFKTSDILATDCSSFLGEYYFSKKPIIFLDKESRCGFNEFGLKMKKTFYIPQNLKELENMFEDILIKGNDPKLKERIRVIGQEYFYPDNGVGAQIVKHIKRKLNLKN